MQLRSYQQRAVNEIGNKNVIVKMPTGSGKTLIAAEVIRKEIANCRDAKAVFLVPNCDLVSQQAQALRSWCGAKFSVAEYMGSATVPECDAYKIIVSTPEAFYRLQMRDQRFSWDAFIICVFDEVHHVLKDHPYRKIAHSVRDEKVQILGLSASLTYAIGDSAVEKTLNGLSRDLGLNGMINISDEELRAGGYDPPHENIEIIHPKVLPEGVVAVKDRRPHLMHSTFFSRIKKGEGTPFAKKLIKIVKGLELITSEVIPEFSSPLRTERLSSWEDYAHKLCKCNPSKAHLLMHLENWYVALRIIVQTWEEEIELVLNWLKSCNALGAENQLLQVPDVAVAAAFQDIKRMITNEANLSKVAALKSQLLEKKALFGSSFRGIVFVQQRITAHILTNFINTDKDLTDASFQADFVTSRDAKITPSLAVSPKKARECIQKFRDGSLNVLIATSVIEEGFDVPAANVVISFDALKDTVELAQRFGRARKQDRRIVVMDQRFDRTIEKLKKVRNQQNQLIDNFNPNNAQRDLKAELSSQQNRENGARSYLLKDVGINEALQTLNIYVKKTKAQSKESTKKAGEEWKHNWQYQSVLRNVEATATASNKSMARKKCAKALLETLRRTCA